MKSSLLRRSFATLFPSGRRLIPIIQFLANFGVAKLAIYIGPLLIAAFCTAPVYGAVELAQSIGLMVTGLIVGAPLAGISQQYLIERDRRIIDVVALITLISCVAGLAATALSWLAGTEIFVLLIFASLATAALQNSGGAIFRTMSMRHWAAWADGFATLAAVLIVGISMLLIGQATRESLAIGYVIIAAFGAIIALVLLKRTRQPSLRDRIMQASAFGIPIVIASVFAIWLAVSGRLLVGLLSPADVAAYSLAFRVAGVTLGIQQITITALFRRLYTARTREADTLSSIFFVAVASMSALIIFAGQLLVDYVRFEALGADGARTFVALLPIACIQVFFGIGYAMLQLRIIRCRLARASILPLAIVTLVGVAGLIGLDQLTELSANDICWFVAAQAAAFFAVLVVLLARRGLPHRRMAIVGTCGGAALSALAMILP